MNKTNVQHAINIMKRAGKLEMELWQGRRKGRQYETTEKDLHACGTAACLGGWIAVSPEFRKDGGRARENNGSPILGGFSYEMAIAKWLDISEELAGKLCTVEENVKFYGKRAMDITKDDVIEKLERVLIGDHRDEIDHEDEIDEEPDEEPENDDFFDSTMADDSDHDIRYM